MKMWYVLLRTWIFVNRVYNKVVLRKEECDYKYFHLNQVLLNIESLEKMVDKVSKKEDKDYSNYCMNWSNGYYLTLKGWFVEKLDYSILRMRVSRTNFIKEELEKMSKKLKIILDIM